MGLVKMYRVTGNPKYLEKAKYFCEEAGRLSDGRPASPYSQDHKPIKEQDEAVGHAVRFGYLYSGVADVAALCQDQGFIEASKRLWNNITDRKLYIRRYRSQSLGRRIRGKLRTSEHDFLL